MPTSATPYFDFVEVFDGSSFTDRTLEAQSPGGTAFSVLEGTDDFLYLGDASRFDMAVFELSSNGSLGTLNMNIGTVQRLLNLHLYQHHINLTQMTMKILCIVFQGMEPNKYL